MTATIGALRDELRATLGADDARTLLALILDVQPAELSMNASRVVDAVHVARVHAALQARVAGAPIAYCAGRAAFRHLLLDVDERVLIPRPETEVLVDEVLRLTGHRPGGIAVDIGTGSGAIALSLALEGVFDRVIATDISTDAIRVATHNFQQLPAARAAVEFRVGSLLEPVRDVKARILVSNPPYIAFEEAAALPPSVRDWEPPLALFTGNGGMAIYETLLDQAPSALEPGGWVVLEVDSTRAQRTARLAESTGHYCGVRLVDDLTGRARVLVAQVPA